MRHYRKQQQHMRRYRSGRWTYVNQGIRYKNITVSDLRLIRFRAYTNELQRIINIAKEEGRVRADIVEKIPILFSELRSLLSEEHSSISYDNTNLKIMEDIMSALKFEINELEKQVLSHNEI